MLTETEALAKCLAPVLDGAKTFGASEAKIACDIMFKLVMNKEIDQDTGSRINSRLGNHSAMRQWAVKQGFLPASDAAEDALAKAVKIELGKKDAMLEEMASAPAKKK